MGPEPENQGSSGGPASRFRKISKPLMEKKRRARINVSLEQLKSLLEKHYSHQGSGRSPAEPSTRRASAAVCRALTSFCGAERRAAAACAAPWRTNAWSAAPWTASAPARRRPRGAAPAPRVFGPRIRPPANRGPRHPGSSSPEVFPARPPASRHRRRLLARAPRAPGRRCACGDPGEAQAGRRTQGGPPSGWRAQGLF
ncbi:transcription factor HES-3 isoform 2-T2 [Hipposideros larvatus]